MSLTLVLLTGKFAQMETLEVWCLDLGVFIFVFEYFVYMNVCAACGALCPQKSGEGIR